MPDDSGNLMNDEFEVPLVKFGNERCMQPVKKGATYRELLTTVPNSDNFNVRIQGEDVQDHLDEEVQQDVTIFISPKRISQG